MLDKISKQRYAKGFGKIEFGYLGHKTSKFYAIHLTTREGDDNSTKRFTKDLQKLIKWIRKQNTPKWYRGQAVEYCGALGYTPKKGLLHFHGLIRVRGGFLKLYEGETKSSTEWLGKDKKRHSAHTDRNRRALGDKWNEIHNAFSVAIDRVYSQKDLSEYITRHILKDYMVVEGGEKAHFLTSQGWAGEIPEELEKEFRRWYLEGGGIVYLERKHWQYLRELKVACLEGRDAELREDFGTFQVVKGKVREWLIPYTEDNVE